MPRWTYTLSTVVLSKSTHDHEVAAMYLPWTTVLRWPLARSLQNEKLRTVHHIIHRQTASYRKHDWMAGTILPAELTNGNWISISNDEIHLWYLAPAELTPLTLQKIAKYYRKKKILAEGYSLYRSRLHWKRIMPHPRLTLQTASSQSVVVGSHISILNILPQVQNESPHFFCGFPGSHKLKEYH